eukprot:TRINITY_DN11828_c0_g1_i1.p1 TRINITY_DN11828_c0_g1~~TRINITY_DN11828_c0_g1_i1.p1  ORF type:complete len:218 (+),score=78.00 TRINITY_DN11828_c0_g1_i1:3-656(+)
MSTSTSLPTIVTLYPVTSSTMSFSSSSSFASALSTSNSVISARLPSSMFANIPNINVDSHDHDRRNSTVSIRTSEGKLIEMVAVFSNTNPAANEFTFAPSITRPEEDFEPPINPIEESHSASTLSSLFTPSTTALLLSSISSSSLSSVSASASSAELSLPSSSSSALSSTSAPSAASVTLPSAPSVSASSLSSSPSSSSEPAVPSSSSSLSTESSPV